MVDSSDIERLTESKQELFSVLQEPEMIGVPVVIIANKQDLPMAMSPDKLITCLELHKLVGRRWHLQGACAPQGEGIYESFDTLGKLVKESARST